eukprot:TRINITY_DN7975_c0_g1_i1.p1 TRINITY_DN7975_c0_g1~~TRINITY_DN7975_c0_g1_i1.p1  ORF type:complete len:217 (+),score=31.49 TRINITY_DN7975_c0_g1_i1:232-882(+)
MSDCQLLANRRAARYRKKKRSRIESLKQSHQQLVDNNNALRDRYATLLSEVTDLREHVFSAVLSLTGSKSAFKPSATNTADFYPEMTPTNLPPSPGSSYIGSTSDLPLLSTCDSVDGSFGNLDTPNGSVLAQEESSVRYRLHQEETTAVDAWPCFDGIDTLRHTEPPGPNIALAWSISASSEVIGDAALQSLFGELDDSTLERCVSLEAQLGQNVS